MDEKKKSTDKAAEIAAGLTGKINYKKEFILIPFIAKIDYNIKESKIELELKLMGKTIASTIIDPLNPTATLGGGIPGAAKAQITFELAKGALNFTSEIDYKSPPVVGEWKTSKSSGMIFQYGKDK